MTSKPVKIEPQWKQELAAEFSKPYFDKIKAVLISEKQKGKIIYPPGPQIFAAFDRCPFDRVKVVIIGQDPYHGPGQAMGLCFSVNRGIRIPASLRNIFKELQQDVGTSIPEHGDLGAWADQGVLLLNTVLTVEKSKAGSHKKLGWQQFTDRVIQILSEKKEHLVFLLWGNYAKSKAHLIDQKKHYILS